ncbi:MAG: ABC transporter ATP-binding protein [Pseudomonadota bacterium]
MIEIQSLVKKYPGLTAVNGIDLKIEKGCCFGLLGPNGAGKTTTIEIMEGITAPTSGKILYKGQALGNTFRQECGIQFQHTALQEYLTVKETLIFFRGLYPNPMSLDEVIETCTLGSFINSDNQKLSGGQRQRLLLGIALINNPSIVFLDEPTTGLDPQARHNFWNLIGSVQARDTTIILSTHYMEEAAELCDEIAIMDHGKIITQGSPKALLQEYFDTRLIRLPEADLHIPIEKLAMDVVNYQGWIEISTRDVGGTLQQLLQLEVNLNNLHIRQHDLEDLFLHLTGKELRA